MTRGPANLALAFLLALSACQRDPYAAVFTKTQPKPEDLAGTYVPTASTKRFLKKHGRYPAAETSITLAPDGTFTLKNIPECWQTELDDSKDGFDSGHGTWKVSADQEWWSVDLQVDSTRDFASHDHADESLSTGFMLAGETPPYKLLLLIGDPDGGKALQFEKATPAP